MAKFRCNLDSSVFLNSEEEATGYFWLRLDRHSYNKKTFETTTNTRLVAHSPEYMKQFLKVIHEQELDTPEKLRAVMNCDSWRIIHDPSLVKNVDDLKIK